MRSEEQCRASERFLFADSYFSDKLILWQQQDSIKRCRDLTKGEAYFKFINWQKQENQLAIFTLYAYADLKIPKKFDCVFRLDNPKEFIETKYELTQSIYEAWLPIDNVEDGHKHLCIFTFNEKIPDLLYLLPQENLNNSLATNGIKLGFCQKLDFESIADRIEKTITLKAKYGTNWWKYDNEI